MQKSYPRSHPIARNFFGNFVKNFCSRLNYVFAQTRSTNKTIYHIYEDEAIAKK
jgi:hypothetical protein